MTRRRDLCPLLKEDEDGEMEFIWNLFNAWG